MRIRCSKISARFAAIGAVFVCGLAGARVRAELAPDAVEFFESKIRPVLAQDCYECHRGTGKRKGGLAVDWRQALRQGDDANRKSLFV